MYGRSRGAKLAFPFSVPSVINMISSASELARGGKTRRDWNMQSESLSRISVLVLMIGQGRSRKVKRKRSGFLPASTPVKGSKVQSEEVNIIIKHAGALLLG